MNLKKKKDLYLKASDYYYNRRGTTYLTDAEFDKLEAEIREVDPEWDQLAKTGIAVDGKKTPVALPFFMPSLDKFYPVDVPKLAKRLKAEYVIISNKLDGGSLQLKVVDGTPMFLATRGDGVTGGDITFLIPSLTSIPRRVGTFTGTLRCEAVMKESVFAAKYASKYENARAAVNGFLNRKRGGPVHADIDIVVLGVYNHLYGAGLTQLDDADYGMLVVKHKIYSTSQLEHEMLSTVLRKRRAASPYLIDGLCVASTDVLFAYPSEDRPKWMGAFKENTDLTNATRSTVLEIVWQLSAKRRWIPKIRIKPVRIAGSTIEYATSHNAQWMVDRGIGAGAIIQIVKSGDVIPKIVNVVKQAEPNMPPPPYAWDGVHLVADAETTESRVRAIHQFMTKLGIEFLASKTIATLYEQGLKTPGDYAKAWASGKPDDFIRAGLGLKTSIKIYNELSRVFAPGLAMRDLMVASNCFAAGIGTRKLVAGEKALGPWLWPKLEALINDDGSDDLMTKLRTRMLTVPGWERRTLDMIIEGMHHFIKWLPSIEKYVEIKRTTKAEKVATVPKGKYSGIFISFTGYRDESQEQALTAQGAEIVSFGKRTNILLYKESGKASSKVAKAKADGITVTTYKDLK